MRIGIASSSRLDLLANASRRDRDQFLSTLLVRLARSPGGLLTSNLTSTPLRRSPRMTRPKVLGPRLFTLAQAQAQLPRVQERLACFQGLYARYEELKREISVLGLVSASGGDRDNPDQEALRVREEEKASLLERMQTVQLELIEVGCVPKSIQDGLIDFFALNEGRLVFLCWKQGEEGIRFWHTLDAGYPGRLPIESFSGESREV
jgi:hypothetical protein